MCTGLGCEGVLTVSVAHSRVKHGADPGRRGRGHQRDREALPQTRERGEARALTHTLYLRRSALQSCAGMGLCFFFPPTYGTFFWSRHNIRVQKNTVLGTVGEAVFVCRFQIIK